MKLCSDFEIMIIERKLDILILKEILKDYAEDVTYADFLDTNYDVSKIQKRYLELGKEFLNDYALNKTEKSDESD